MSEPTSGTVDPASIAAAPPVGEAAAAVVPAFGQLRVGQRWRDLMVESMVPDEPGSFIANHLGLMERVVVREFRMTDSHEWRRGAWERLCALPESKVVRCLEAHEEEGWRYEISALPPAMTLREWMGCHRPDFGGIEALMRQIAGTLGTLHAQGVVHLNIRPESIHIDETKGDPVYLLGGLRHATLYTHPELSPEEVDPLYAPPEATGMERHASGTRLCAWDWWSVGRVVQEFLIGHHVFALVFDCDVSRMTPALRARAELLQLEREPPGVRAGALDYTIADAGCMPLLRGLLTSSCEARWGLDAVQRWLKREPVRDHYDLPRDARLWSWKGRVLTIAEAAEFFTRAEHWEAGEDMLFHPHEPETLVRFLNDVPAHRADLERLQAVCDLAESTAWEQLPVIARRTVTAALAWLSLGSGAGARMNLRVRGHAIDLAGLGELLKEAGIDVGVALVSALLSPGVIRFVETLDATSARFLKTQAAKAGLAVQRAQDHGWLDPHDSAGHARMFELALENSAVLRERVDLLHATHATNRDAGLAAVFANKSPDPAELVILAFAGENPERHGFITHEEWRRQRCGALKGEAERLVGRLLWLRLRGLLTVARLWGAPSTVFMATVLSLTIAAGAISRSVGPASAVASALLFSRVWLWWRVRGGVRSHDAHAAPWQWTDGLARARIEAKRVCGEGKATISDLSEDLRGVRERMEELATPTFRVPRMPEARWWDVRLVIVLAVLTMLAALVQPFAGERAWSPSAAMSREPAPDDAVISPGENGGGAVKPTPAAEMAVDAAALVATGRYEIVDDGFGRRLRGPLQTWEFYAPLVVPAAQIEARAPVSPEQSAFALVSATLLLQPYARKSAQALLAVRVPTTRGFGVVLFNARDRVLAGREVLLLREAPGERTWQQFGARRALYLGSPLPMDAEISLAPP